MNEESRNNGLKWKKSEIDLHAIAPQFVFLSVPTGKIDRRLQQPIGGMTRYRYEDTIYYR
jgi:hypothetical protein